MVKVEQIRIWRDGHPDDEASNASLVACADDRVFRLDRANLMTCKPLITDRKDLAALPEDGRWDFLRGKSVPYRGGNYWIFDTKNVDDKMDLAAKLGYRPSACKELAILNINC